MGNPDLSPLEYAKAAAEEIQRIKDEKELERNMEQVLGELGSIGALDQQIKQAIDQLVEAVKERRFIEGQKRPDQVLSEITNILEELATAEYFVTREEDHNSGIKIKPGEGGYAEAVAAKFSPAQQIQRRALIQEKCAARIRINVMKLRQLLLEPIIAQGKVKTESEK